MAREMKNSGVEWIGEIPVEWKLKKGKFLFAQRAEKGNAIELQLLSPTQKFGVVPQNLYEALSGMKAVKLSEDTNLADFKSIYIGDFCISLRSFQGGFEYSLYNGVVSPAYQVFYKITQDTFDGFYKYMFKEQSFIAYMTSFTKTFRDGKSISFAYFANSLLPVPPLNEQQKIASFLDQKCAEIDAVIEKTKATIEEYKKLKQSVITEAVTKGIRGNRPMKDSGIEWIGEIPVGWTKGKVGYFFEIQLGKMLQPNKGTNTDTIEKYLCAANVGGNCFKLTPIKEMWFKPNEKVIYSVLNGDLLVVEGGDIASCDIVKGCNSPLYIQNALHRVRAKGKQDIRFLKYWLWFAKSIGHIELICNKATIAHFSKEKFTALPYVIATNEESEIADYLDQKCAEFDTLIAKKTTLLSELENYKKSLIYEYVTGKKEVGAVSDNTTITIVYPYFPAILSTDKTRFAQAVLMSKILDSNVKYMGRVKLEKMLFTIEHSLGFDFDTEYAREMAGPLDSSIYECEKIISRTNKWFYVNNSHYGTSYKPQKNIGKYKRYYEQYFSDYNEEIESIISVFKNYSLDQSEIIATLFAAWNDAIIDKKQFTDEDIVNDVLNNWHKTKKRFKKDVWLRAMEEMKKINLIPKGYGKKTVIKKIRCKG